MPFVAAAARTDAQKSYPLELVEGPAGDLLAVSRHRFNCAGPIKLTPATEIVEAALSLYKPDSEAEALQRIVYFSTATINFCSTAYSKD